MAVQRIKKVLEKALQESRITQQEWENLLTTAVDVDEAVLHGENDFLNRLVALLEGGEVGVEGVTLQEVLERLSAFL